MKSKSIEFLHFRNFIVFYLIAFLLDIIPGVSPKIIVAMILALLQLVVYLIYIFLTKGRETNIYVPIVMAVCLGSHGLFYVTINTILFLFRLGSIKTNESITLPLYTFTLITCIISSVIIIRIFDRLFSKKY